MMKPSRRRFFEAYMSMFAGPVYKVTYENSDSIVGELIWPREPGYCEEVRWDSAEVDVPSITCFRLVSFIAEQALLDIDRIPMSREELHESFNKHTKMAIPFTQFDSALEELLAITIPRLKDGQEFDDFFVHE